MKSRVDDFNCGFGCVSHGLFQLVLAKDSRQSFVVESLVKKHDDCVM